MSWTRPLPLVFPLSFATALTLSACKSQSAESGQAADESESGDDAQESDHPGQTSGSRGSGKPPNHSESDDGDIDCEPGTENCECRDDGSCDPGLRCFLNRCTNSGEDPEDIPKKTTGDSSREDTGLPTDEGNEDNDDTGAEPYPGWKIDLLFVVDSSHSMGEEQQILARDIGRFIDRFNDIDVDDSEFGGPDLQVMFTTTDFGNPLCQDDHHAPERGAPVVSPCTQRLEHFTSIDAQNPETVDEACTDACSDDIELEDGANYLHFRELGRIHNIKSDLDEKDINGDGIPESPAAQAAACIAPQGIDGCGYEAPLESMMQATYPGAPWNSGAQPFLRDDAALGIIIITDEADCSVKDYSMMSDPEFISSLNGKKTHSSAICWNAGVECDPDPDNPGWYTACRSLENHKLHPIQRYTDYLVEHMLKKKGKEVFMLGIWGVPEVTGYSDELPRLPIEGGVRDLQYRHWADPEYPDGDILPEDWPHRNAEYRQWEFGIGPGCTSDHKNEFGESEFHGQAIPPVRMLEVCQALDEAETELNPNPDDRRARCCIESICDDEFDSAFRCMSDMLIEQHIRR